MPYVRRTPFAHHVYEAHLSYADLSDITGIPVYRIRDYAIGKANLQPHEIEEVQQIIAAGMQLWRILKDETRRLHIFDMLSESRRKIQRNVDLAIDLAEKVAAAGTSTPDFEAELKAILEENADHLEAAAIRRGLAALHAARLLKTAATS